MRFSRLAAAVFALAVIAGPVAAQVKDVLTPPGDPPAAADPAVAPPKTDGPTNPPSVKVAPVPEPGSILLLAGAGSAVGWVTYWRRKWRAEPKDNGTTPQP
ncbi:MAG TPA: PEP-CTERM sorting domain-containing protein [Gemmataceae bacterium]|nr:PEP-CTERM sorting domain-containing protein [Gemmataceae bacterium]